MDASVDTLTWISKLAVAAKILEEKAYMKASPCCSFLTIRPVTATAEVLDGHTAYISHIDTPTSWSRKPLDSGERDHEGQRDMFKSVSCHYCAPFMVNPIKTDGGDSSESIGFSWKHMHWVTISPLRRIHGRRVGKETDHSTI
jgi:hypothetical protein